MPDYCFSSLFYLERINMVCLFFLGNLVGLLESVKVNILGLVDLTIQSI